VFDLCLKGLSDRIDLNTGPTSIIGLLTGHIVGLLSRGGMPGGPPPAGMFPPTGAAAASGVPTGVFPSLGAPTATGIPAGVPSGVFAPTVAMATGTVFAGPVPTGGAFPGMATGASPALASPPGGNPLAGFPHLPPALIAATVAFSVGILALVMGALKLGWLLDFVSLPILTGFIMGAAITIILGQIPSLLGEVGVSTNFIQQSRDIVSKIGTAKPLTVIIGFSAIFLLLILQFAGKKWGKRSNIIWFLSISRNAIVLILFTGISFGVNKDLKTPLWAITGKVPSGLQAPAVPPLPLVKFVVFLSFPVFITAALEHVAIAKSFGRKNGYTIDQSQELVFLGVANLTNGIFGGMPVGGTLSRISINSESGVKSPLGGIFTSGIVLLGIFALTGVLSWIPKATLSAVIIVAVLNILPPISLIAGYWKTSFADFMANFITMQITLLASAEMGIGLGVAFMVFYTLIRTTFAHARLITRTDLENQYIDGDSFGNGNNIIPPGTQVVSFDQAIIFLNADRIKKDIVDLVQTYNSGVPAIERTGERSWSDLGEKHIASLRRKAGVVTPTKLIPRIKVLVLDFSRVGFIDTTGLQILRDMKAEVLAYGGEDVEFRFVGLNESMKKKFQRTGWNLANAADAMNGFGEGRDVIFELLKPAIEAPKMVRDSGLDFGFGNVLMRETGSVYGVDRDEEKGEQKVIVTSVLTRDGKAYKES